MRHILAMGGYGIYVWSAYGIVGGILLFQWVLMAKKLGKTRQKLAQKYVKSS